ncbi:unnamed protein product [Caenorhabditis auriculariae]|uniref:AMOP domain-containing protein n=1 Tax=Caenorhabditis auriculariae TaxID=2777116 RepID=A0A8S1GYB5_9PELO|nr:unnamed protein product [Caenorhabditis auriculariae]
MQLLLISLIPLLAAQYQQAVPFYSNFDNKPISLDQTGRVDITHVSDQFGQGFTEYEGNLVRYGVEFGDEVIRDNQRQNGKLIRLHNFFPFYGARYNYTMISTNGFISFAHFSDDSSTLKLGLDVDWPTQSDPAVIAPYLCKQRIQNGLGADSAVYYRLEVRSSAARSNPIPLASESRSRCLGKQEHVRCDAQSDQFLDAMQRALQQGVAGASTFRAEAALVVTWKNLRPNIGSEEELSTFQLVWLTDAQGLLSYTMINYYKLGYEAADMNGNSRTGRCQAIFNGGNHTGSVQVDLSEQTKQQPSSLAHRSSIPHVARGRYVHRVDDVVRPAGCSNKTGGTFPLLIYPNIASMLGQTKVDVNGLCLNPSETYVLMIEQRQIAPCEILNPSIARCTLPKILDWGTKTVYFQPQSGLSNEEKAYVGFIYFVPPTIDPMRLDIGDLHSWYLNPPPTHMTIKWYPRNFTQSRVLSQNNEVNYFDDSIYNFPIGLYVVGYKEAQDVQLKKFVPKHRVLARMATFQNRAEEHYRWHPLVEHPQIDQVEEWFLGRDEFKSELFTYRFGYLKLAPLHQSAESVFVDPHHGRNIELDEGMVSSPISLHWLWTLPSEGEYRGSKQDREQKANFVKNKAREMCHDWYDEDGALNNFLRDTETNSSCPCKVEQARMDLGRFMPHPRCSTLFRDVSCTETLGSMNCFMSAQNVRGSAHRRTKHGTESSSYSTHYGQTCCYDAKGFLMQSSYQPIIKVDDSTPYSPGFPTRAYEMGSEPFQGMFEVPGLSSFHHDLMPYYLCCKFADFRCQMFYWRRPSSACQAYEPPVTGSIQGAGIISTLNNRNLIFNEPGIFSFLHAHKTHSTPEVQVQVRMERFPDRSIDFGALNIEQRDLVQPTNTTVVTGVVVQSEGADRVHVLLRKDTRRGRYKTSIIIGNVIRYFDNMHLQRFRGLTVYVNNVEKGQAEIFVVIDKAQIGLRIRESYAIDIDRKFQYMESLGLLDVQVSVPPQYKLIRSEQLDLDRPRVEGLINPFPDESFQDFGHSQLAWGAVNDQGTRQQLLRYMVKGEAETMSVNLAQQNDDVTDLFTSRSDQENLFQAFADHFLKGPVYKTPSAHMRNEQIFKPVDEVNFRAFLSFCKTRRAEPEYLSREERKTYRRCPTDLAGLETECGSDVPCLFDAVMLQARLLGDEARNSYNYYQRHRFEGIAKYNSCGAMNIEFPEYLIKGPSSGEPAYLEGDKLSFSCFQTHIIKGDAEFTCSKRYNEHDRTYRMQWTMGGQPWCRHRAKDNVLTWLFWTSVVIALLTVVISIFAVFWYIKQSHKNNMKKKQEVAKNSHELMPLNMPPRSSYLQKPMITTTSSEIFFDKEPRGNASSTSSSSRRDLKLPSYSSGTTSANQRYQPRRERPGEIAV